MFPPKTFQLIADKLLEQIKRGAWSRAINIVTIMTDIMNAEVN